MPNQDLQLYWPSYSSHRWGHIDGADSLVIEISRNNSAQVNFYLTSAATASKESSTWIWECSAIHTSLWDDGVIPIIWSV